MQIYLILSVCGKKCYELQRKSYLYLSVSANKC